ncbi:MAG: hypothetical protein ACRDIC_15155 [bacterium]
MATDTGVFAKSSNLCFISGRELADLIRARKLSAREVMAAYLQQIDRVNPKVNAIVAKLDDAKCLALGNAHAFEQATGFAQKRPAVALS